MISTVDFLVLRVHSLEEVDAEMSDAGAAMTGAAAARTARLEIA